MRSSRSRKVATGVVQLRTSALSPNVHIVGATLVDAGTRLGARKLLRQLADARVERLALTHVHPPTQGAAARLCDELGLELWCGAADVATAESGDLSSAQPQHWFNPIQRRLFAGPGHPVARALSQGDRVEDFEVLEVPGHSPGHIALWREHDRVLFIGDVLNNENVWTGRTGLQEPPAMFTPDPEVNRASARRLVALRPDAVLFSHGPPLRDLHALERFVETLGS